MYGWDNPEYRAVIARYQEQSDQYFAELDRQQADLDQRSRAAAEEYDRTTAANAAANDAAARRAAAARPDPVPEPPSWPDRDRRTKVLSFQVAEDGDPAPAPSVPPRAAPPVPPPAPPAPERPPARRARPSTPDEDDDGFQGFGRRR